MYVVTGATGNVGRSLVRILAAAGEPVRATSRNISAAGVPDGVRYARADLVDAESLRPVLEGAGTLFLQNGGPSMHRLAPRALLGVAKAAGVGRVVLLSSQGVVTRPASASHGHTARAIEDAVRESGLEWTVLRPGGFASNAYAWAESVRAQRLIAAPFADTGLPVVDPDDIAEVAAAAMTEDGHHTRAYELTGPAPSTPRERAAAVAEALGEPVRFVEQTRDEAREQMLRFLPAPVVETTLDILGEPTAAEQRVSPDTERILGRAPRTFADWAARHIAAFR
ncbi:NAD(P)H-binding protein [Streptomyces ficellus]|uniref:NmrA family transcriptional regulator n=1 Tax=Streptomyces ficellus TaxID=1977088 RepID=A0A6I6FH96_9ACTN|nr:NAD(P)H-binding protein [Streptomyces ficellus]QGV80577.1 NmrA family transcriptional regulator [Streptomyces ficellus]